MPSDRDQFAIDGQFCTWYSTVSGGVWVSDHSLPFTREIDTCLAWSEL